MVGGEQLGGAPVTLNGGELLIETGDNMTVGEICRRDFLAVEASTPVINVTHQMVKNRRRRIYVLDDGKPVGVVFRKNIVTRVLHF